MTGILMLESLTRGNTLKQGDKTPLTYKLLDADGDNLNVAGKTATVRLVYPNYLTIGYEKSGLSVQSDDTVTFTIDKIIPARKYHVEIIVDNKFVFPSRSAESKFTIDRSSLGTETNIIEIIGKEALIRTVKSQVDTELQPLVTSMESARQAEAQRVLAENERRVKYENYAQQFNDVITDLSEEKDYNSLPEISAARGGHETLGQRLDETDAQLAQTDVTHNQMETVKSLPVGSKDGPVKDFEYKGQTLVNLIENGDFSDGTVHWQDTYNIGSMSNINGQLQVIPAENKTAFISATSHYLHNEDAYFMFATAELVSGSGSPSACVSIGNTISFMPISSSKVTELYRKAKKGNRQFPELVLSGSTDTPTVLFDNVIVVNMSQLGIEDYTAEQMAELVRGGHFDGMKSAKADVKTVGKNLWNDDEAYGASGDVSRIPNGFRMGPNSHLRLLLDVNVGSRYSISAKTTHSDDSAWSLRIRDINNSLLPAGGKEGYIAVNDKLRFEIYNHISGGAADFTDIQLEESATATPYDPYKSSTLTVEPTLHRLPNGVADRVFEQDGEMWLERNVGEHTLVESDVNQYGNVFPKVTRLRIWGRQGQQNISNNSTIGSYLLENFTTISYNDFDGDKASSVGKTAQANSDKALYFGVSPSKYTTLAEAQADLAGTKLLYQLATPELINLTEQGLVAGELMSYANGTSYNNGSLKGEVSFKVPTSTGAQITSLVGSSERQAKQITVLSDHVAKLISGV